MGLACVGLQLCKSCALVMPVNMRTELMLSSSLPKCAASMHTYWALLWDAQQMSTQAVLQLSGSQQGLLAGPTRLGCRMMGDVGLDTGCVHACGDTMRQNCRGPLWYSYAYHECMICL